MIIPRLLAAALIASVICSAGALSDDLYPGLVRNGQVIPGAKDSIGQDLKTWDLPVDVELIKKRNNFGYTDDEIKKYFSASIQITLDETGLDRRLIKPAPPTGVHPRVFFNPEDLPAIRERLKTASGKAVMDGIRNHIQDMLTGPSAKYAADYDKLAKGDPSVDIYKNVDLPYTLMYEAFRCLVDDDKVGGAKVAAALAAMAPVISKNIDDEIAKAKDKYAKDMEKYNQTHTGPAPIDLSNDFNAVAITATFQGTFGLDYDFAYNWMTDDQRNLIRSTLSKATTGMTNIGCETLRAFNACVSNHIPWENRLIYDCAAIEGEPGYDAGAYKRCEDAQTDYINAIFPTGEAFEGWGKNFLCMEHMIIMAKRGKNLLACTKIRANFNNYYVASLNPWGNAFTFCDSLGGTGIKIARNADVVMYHALFPQDLAGDFIYRSQIDGDYSKILGGPVNTHHYFAVMDALCCALYATDLMPAMLDARMVGQKRVLDAANMMPTDFDKELAQISEGRPLTYFSEDTCNMITRSAWSRDALYLNYLTRAVPGGHVYCDRSHFSLYGLGRYWGIYHFGRQIHEQYGPAMRSVLMVDDEGPSIMEGKCVNFTDQPLASFTATDISAAWNYNNGYLIRAPAGVPSMQNPYSYNDFRLHPSSIPWMSMPIGILPEWETSVKPDPTFKADWWKRPVQVVKAFRTAGLIRGPHPYCLIVDDLQKDNQPHLYDWGMVLNDDLTLGSAKLTGNAASPQADIILDENPNAPGKQGGDGKKDRHLLVRVLSAAALNAAKVACVDVMQMPNPPQKNMQINKLHITSQTVSPDFKILLFPFREGQSLPATTWSTDHTTATVSWPDQTDKLTFTPGHDGRTRIKIVREGNELIQVD